MLAMRALKWTHPPSLSNCSVVLVKCLFVLMRRRMHACLCAYQMRTQMQACTCMQAKARDFKRRVRSKGVLNITHTHQRHSASPKQTACNFKAIAWPDAVSNALACINYSLWLKTMHSFLRSSGKRARAHTHTHTHTHTHAHTHTHTLATPTSAWQAQRFCAT